MVMSDHADTCEGQPWKWQGHRQDHLRKAQGHNPQGHGQGRLELHTLFVSKIEMSTADRLRKVNMESELAMKVQGQQN